MQPVLVTCPSSLHAQKFIRTINRDSISPLFRNKREFYFIIINPTCPSDIRWLMKYKHKWQVALLAGSLRSQHLICRTPSPLPQEQGTLQIMEWETKGVVKDIKIWRQLYQQNLSSSDKYTQYIFLILPWNLTLSNIPYKRYCISK